MKIENYVQHIPTIETWIRESQLDTLVCGLGPTAWLLPWIDQKLLENIRLFGCHDAFRIMPMHDIVVMDQPANELHPDRKRFDYVINGRPRRLWLYEPNSKPWLSVIPACMRSVTKTVVWDVCRPDQAHRKVYKIPFKLEAANLHTSCISPTGMTTLAWREGCRRIGVIGVDMMKGHHHTHRFWPLVDAFFLACAKQAAAAGGLIRNLSPITSLEQFRKCPSSTSGSDPTDSSKSQEPRESLSTPSGNAPHVMSTSTGCEPAIPNGPSVSMAIQALGDSVAQ